MAGFTRLSKALSVLLAALFALTYFFPASLQHFALIPGRSLTSVWTLLTCGFVTTNPFKLLAEVLVVLLVSRVVEPVYGSRELLKFLAVVDVAGALAALTLSYVAYAATLDGDLLYTPFSGGHGLVAGLLVALKQATPGQDVRLLGRVALQTRYLPLLYVLAASATAALVRGAWTLLPFVLAGSYCAWLYLRFFQPCGGPGDAATRYGDASDDFRFSTFFPDLLATPLDLLSAACSAVTRLRHDPADVSAAAAAGATSLAGPSLVGAAAEDASRRRERGAKALEERLGAKGGGAATALQPAAAAAQLAAPAAAPPV